MPTQNGTAVRVAFSVLSFLLDVATITLSAGAAGMVYHQTVYGLPLGGDAYLGLGAILALFVVTPNLLARHYVIDNYVSLKGHIRSLLMQWNLAAMGALAVAFLTKTSADFSRGAGVFVYIFGFASLALGRAALVHLVRSDGAAGAMLSRRVFLVGREEQINAFISRHDLAEMGLDVVAASVLRPGMGTLPDDLALAAASARMLRPDDVYILAPWSDTETIDATVDAFLRVPAAIHLGPERVLERFERARIDKVGSLQSLFLVHRPMNPMQIFAKRAMDVALSAALMVALSPLLALVALLIKLDSKGPVFFAQRRYGFNQQPFRVFKFRSMTTMDDGAVVRQATKGDMRVTRVGAWLRRLSIDELPQLFNVLRGDMSLVGPRPHALAHDQAFERRIALYARRHNVKPGITGWAQVNGLRGETDTDDKMRARVEHDLFYIDNWSLGFDLKILLLTGLSPKTYQNAH
jgi:Undecaprenyl-phosphate glucose phosphotransferase